MQLLARLQGVRRRYGKTIALDGLDLSLRTGEVTSLLGANGAGKTTAIGLLLGLLAADEGVVEVFGQAPGASAGRLRTGVMLQSAGIPERLRVGELLDLVRSYYPQPRSVADCVAMAGLDGLLGRRYGRLSGGQQRRVQFALAICGRPQLLFLDEPTTGLDIEARQGMWKAIRELVAEGTVQEIRAHVSQRRIRCVSALDAAHVAQWPGVRTAAREGDALRIVADTAECVVRNLLDADPSLQELEVQRAGLADAFLEITRNTEQEAA